MGSSNCSADRKLRAREVGGGRRSGLNGLNGLRSGLNGSARKSWKRRRRREEEARLSHSNSGALTRFSD